MAAIALVYENAGQAVLKPAKLSAISEKSVLIQSIYSGISKGTESLVYAGKVPRGEWERMRCPHQVGAFSFPLSYGYALVGKVIETGSKVDQFLPGDMIFVLHPHQNKAVVDAAMVHKLPDAVPPLRAVLAANMETALNAVWDGNIKEGSKVCVTGGGVVGLLTGFLAQQICRTRVTLVDINENKRHVAKKLGLSFTTPQDAPQECDVVFHTSASAGGLQTALSSAAFEGRIIEMSWYGDKEIAISLGGAFHSKRLQIISSQVGHVSPKRRATTTYRERMAEALLLLENPVLDHLLEPAIAFQHLPHHLAAIFQSDSNVLCQVVEYDSI